MNSSSEEDLSLTDKKKNIEISCKDIDVARKLKSEPKSKKKKTTTADKNSLRKQVTAMINDINNLINVDIRLTPRDSS